MKKDLTVSAGILFYKADFHQNLYCCCRRSQPIELAGFWEFPGGKVEVGETPVQALRREISEELHLKIFGPTFFCNWLVQQPKTTISINFFLAQTKKMPLVSTSHDAVVWLTISDLIDQFHPNSSHILLPSNQNALELLAKSHNIATC
jgi:8-oxo-dGTP diphosphatase